MWKIQFFFWNVSILFTGCCRTTIKQTRIFRCWDIKNIQTNNSNQSTHMKPSTSAFITNWVANSIYLLLTSFSQSFSTSTFYNVSCSKPILIAVCSTVAKESLWGCVTFFAVFYYFNLLNTNTLITLYSDILTMNNSLMKPQKPQCTFDKEHSFIWRNFVRLGDVKVEFSVVLC